MIESSTGTTENRYFENTIDIEIAPYEEGIDALIDYIRKYFINGDTADFLLTDLENEVSRLLDELRDDLYLVIEYPYVDKFYRDSYYNYYSSKHNNYQRDCIRVSLFEGEIEIGQFIKQEKHESLEEAYLGFFILRPTINSIMGRSMINPKAFDDSNFKICSCSVNSMIYGLKANAKGFPHSSQDGESIKCAETTIWELMEYFSNKYSEYKPTLPHEINLAIERFSFQRQLPSNGLSMDQISFALKQFGFGTRVYSKDTYGDEIYEIIDTYVESGIPVVVGLQSSDIGHVILCIGKETITHIELDEVKKNEYFKNDEAVNYFMPFGENSRYVVQDDNLIPYRLVQLNNPGELYQDDELKKYQIDSIVVPLYPKIYLEAVLAKKLFFELLKDNTLGLELQSDFIFRYYLASSRTFKNHISKLEKLGEDIKNSLLLTKMPKFIWCGEIYDRDEFNSNEKRAKSLILLDATEANTKSIDSLIFAGYPSRSIFFTDNKFVSLQYGLDNYHYFSNLK